MLDWSQLNEERLGKDMVPELPARVVIPRPHKSIVEFMEIASDSAVDVQKVAEAINKDMELTFQVLRMTNSAAFGLSQKVSSIPRAIALLGHRRCKMLVMSAALTASMRSANQSIEGSDDFLSKSLERAIFSRRTAVAVGGDPEVAYIAGLLQDLVLPFLFQAYRSDYESFATLGGQLSRLESEHFGWDHATMTASVLRSWKFPEEVVCCVAWHHDLETILDNDRLRRSSLIAPAVSGLLPDAFQQEPDGMLKLFQVQETNPEFRFIEIAAEVDEEFYSEKSSVGHRGSLYDQLSKLAMHSIADQRKSTNWLGRTIGRYTLEHQIGEGSMGVVYRARHSMLRRPAAVKLMTSAQLNSQALSRFEKEAQITSELSSPHTVQIYDYGTTPEGVLFYVMEYLDGISLRELIEKHGPQPEGRVIHILSQICGSLAEAHAKGLIHRDVKPDNIVLSICGGVHDFAKLLDFGLVEVIDRGADHDGPTSVQGTPLFMAPEAILQPEDIDERTDVYALGAVAHFLLTADPLFPCQKVVDVLHHQVNHDPRTPSDHLGHAIADDLERLVMQCLLKAPDQRPPSVLHVAEELSRCRLADDWTFEDARDWWTQRDEHGVPQPIPKVDVPSPIDASEAFEDATSTTQIGLEIEHASQ